MVLVDHGAGPALLTLLAQYRIPVLFGFILLEEAGIPIPIPGDLLVMTAGSTSQQPYWLFGLIIVTASVAAFAGSSLLFALMRYHGRPLLAKYGKFIHMTPKRIAEVEKRLITRGQPALIIGRLLPGVRIATTIVAGLTGMSYRQYAVGAAVAAVLWSTVDALLGAGIAQAVMHLFPNFSL